jgi:hypothetical protein
MEPVRYEYRHETGKTPYGATLTAVAVIENHHDSRTDREAMWSGALLGRGDRSTISQTEVLVTAPTADGARKQLAAALRKIADNLDQTALP